MRLTQKLAIGATSLGGLAIGSLGLGIAHAQTTAPRAPAPVVSTPAAVGGNQTAPTAETPDAPEVGATADAPGGHQDPPGANVQSGAQNGPDTGGTDAGANK